MTDSARETIIQSLVYWRSQEVVNPTRNMVAAISGRPANGGHFKFQVHELQRDGIVLCPSPDKLLLATHVYREPMTNGAAKQMLLSSLSNDEVKAMLYLVTNGMSTRVALAAHMGKDVAANSFQRLASKMVKKDLCRRPESRSLEASEWTARILKS